MKTTSLEGKTFDKLAIKHTNCMQLRLKLIQYRGSARMALLLCQLDSRSYGHNFSVSRQIFQTVRSATNEKESRITKDMVDVVKFSFLILSCIAWLFGIEIVVVQTWMRYVVKIHSISQISRSKC